MAPFSTLVVCLFLLLVLGGCTAAPSTRASAKESVERPAARSTGEIRLTGTIRAVRYFNIQVPQVSGRLMLIKLIANGSKVQPGDLLAQFDPTDQIEAARTAQAYYEDYGHQVDQQAAYNRAVAAQREAALAQAEADLTKATIELQKGPLLSEIDRLKNQARADDARSHVESLTKSNALHEQSAAAQLRVLELQRDRQKVALDRSQNNLRRLEIRAPIAGMVAIENIFRNNSFGHPQEGDQLYPGQPLIKIFDPSQMAVTVTVGEPEGAALTNGTEASVVLDAYPDLSLPARFESANPVASAALGTPVKSFHALFVLEQSDPRVLPDMDAAVILRKEEGSTR